MSENGLDSVPFAHHPLPGWVTFVWVSSFAAGIVCLIGSMVR